MYEFDISQLKPSEAIKLKKIAEYMATQPDGYTGAFSIDGGTLSISKDPDGGERSGLGFSIKALAMRIAQGDIVDESEIEILIQKAQKFGEEYDVRNVIRDFVKRFK